jgi:hypothetical protein
MDKIFISDVSSTESENHMSKILAFIAALPLTVMPMPFAFMMFSAAQESPAVAEQQKPTVRQEITVTGVPTSNDAVNRSRVDVREKLSKTRRKCGRRDADCRQRNQRKLKQIVVPSGINDAFAANVNQIRIHPGN